MKKNSSSKSKLTNFALITDERNEFFTMLPSEKFIGEVSLYVDDSKKVVGDFKAKDKSMENYSWEWAHKIYYSYDRVTGMVGNGEGGYFENIFNEYIYIFENLTDNEVEIIKSAVRGHHLMFVCKDTEMNFVSMIANITHNYYCAFESTIMKYFVDEADYEKYLFSAKEHVTHMRELIIKFDDSIDIKMMLESAINNIREFMDNNEVRNYLKNLHSSKFAI